MSYILRLSFHIIEISCYFLHITPSRRRLYSCCYFHIAAIYCAIWYIIRHYHIICFSHYCSSIVSYLFSYILCYPAACHDIMKEIYRYFVYIFSLSIFIHYCFPLCFPLYIDIFLPCLNTCYILLFIIVFHININTRSYFSSYLLQKFFLLYIYNNIFRHILFISHWVIYITYYILLRRATCFSYFLYAGCLHISSSLLFSLRHHSILYVVYIHIMSPYAIIIIFLPLKVYIISSKNSCFCLCPSFSNTFVCFCLSLSAIHITLIHIVTFSRKPIITYAIEFLVFRLVIYIFRLTTYFHIIHVQYWRYNHMPPFFFSPIYRAFWAHIIYMTFSASYAERGCWAKPRY